MEPRDWYWWPRAGVCRLGTRPLRAILHRPGKLQVTLADFPSPFCLFPSGCVFSRLLVERCSLRMVYDAVPLIAVRHETRVRIMPLPLGHFVGTVYRAAWYSRLPSSRLPAPGADTAAPRVPRKPAMRSHYRGRSTAFRFVARRNATPGSARAKELERLIRLAPEGPAGPTAAPAAAAQVIRRERLQRPRARAGSAPIVFVALAETEGSVEGIDPFWAVD